MTDDDWHTRENNNTIYPIASSQFRPWAHKNENEKKKIYKLKDKNSNSSCSIIQYSSSLSSSSSTTTTTTTTTKTHSYTMSIFYCARPIQQKLEFLNITEEEIRHGSSTSNNRTTYTTSFQSTSLSCIPFTIVSTTRITRRSFCILVLFILDSPFVCFVCVCVCLSEE